MKSAGAAEDARTDHAAISSEGAGAIWRTEAGRAVIARHACAQVRSTAAAVAAACHIVEATGIAVSGRQRHDDPLPAFDRQSPSRDRAGRRDRQGRLAHSACGGARSCLGLRCRRRLDPPRPARPGQKGSASLGLVEGVRPLRALRPAAYGRKVGPSRKESHLARRQR